MEQLRYRVGLMQEQVVVMLAQVVVAAKLLIRVFFGILGIAYV
jgi:hypothetical protein